MVEVEAKVRLDRVQVNACRKTLRALGRFQGIVAKTDWYYGRPNSFQLRIRKIGRGGFLGLKSRKLEKGIESNQEGEWPIGDCARWHRLLVAYGWPRFATKVKLAESYRLGGRTHAELCRVRGLGWFLEIEILVRLKSDINSAKKELCHWFRQFGFGSDDFEPKRYLELLVKKRENT
jgi:predicted adenylyl cyclase CyaB